MQLRWAMLCGALVVACGHAAPVVDDGRDFLGSWSCAGGSRHLACGDVMRDADFELGPPNQLEFVQGTSTNLNLVLPSRLLVPGVAYTTCTLAFDGADTTAGLHAASVCTDDNGLDFPVQQGTANVFGSALSLVMDAHSNTDVASVDGCSVHTEAQCSPSSQ